MVEKTEVLEFGVCKVCKQRIRKVKTYAGNVYWQHASGHKAEPQEELKP